jgi:hypothetical protein
MATLVQVKEDKGQWKTLLAPDDRRFIAKQYKGRTISQTALQRSDGMPGFTEGD